MTKAIIIVDVQNDFCVGGSLAVADGAEVAHRIYKMLTSAGMAPDGSPYETIVATKDNHIDPGEHFSTTPDFVDSWPVHCAEGTPGADFHPDLKAQYLVDDVPIFTKGEYDAAYSGFEGKNEMGWDLHEYLSNLGVTEIDVVGIAFDYCVKATAIGGANLGYKVTVLKPLTASVNPANDTQVIGDLIKANVHIFLGNQELNNAS